MIPFESKEQAADYFRQSNPFSTCDFMLKVEANGLDKYYPLVSFNFPQCGVTYNKKFNYPHPTPEVGFGPIELSILQLKPSRVATIVDTDVVLDPTKSLIDVYEPDLYQNNFNLLWARQFNNYGQLKFIPMGQRPEVTIYTLHSHGEILFHCDGCVFSYPRPAPSYSSDTACQFSVTISYENACIYSLNSREDFA